MSRGGVAIISPWPQPGGMPASGVAAYCAAMLDALPPRSDVIVMAQHGAAAASLAGVRVEAVWTPGWAAPRQLRRAIRKHAPALVHAHHEFNILGGVASSFALMNMLRFYRHRGGRVVTTLHGVVDPSEVGRDFAIRNHLPRAPVLLKQAFILAYRLTGNASDIVIVHHEHFKRVLVTSYGIGARKIRVVPHGVAASITRPRRLGGPPRILTLGFLTGYKRPEVVLDLAERGTLGDAVFEFCVGANPRIRTKGYRERYAALERRVRGLGARGVWRGYIPDDALPATLAAADVLVLPYTECVAASGVAAHARAAQLPICHSTVLSPLFGETPRAFSLRTDSLERAVRYTLDETGANPDGKAYLPWSRVAELTYDVWDEALAIKR